MDKNNTVYLLGHANYIAISALLPSAIFPEKTNKIFGVAVEAINNIVTAWLHWYTDVEVDKYLGGVLSHDLRIKPAFIVDMNRTRTALLSTAQ